MKTTKVIRGLRITSEIVSVCLFALTAVCLFACGADAARELFFRLRAPMLCFTAAYVVLTVTEEHLNNRVLCRYPKHV